MPNPTMLTMTKYNWAVRFMVLDRESWLGQEDRRYIIEHCGVHGEASRNNSRETLIPHYARSFHKRMIAFRYATVNLDGGEPVLPNLAAVIS